MSDRIASFNDGELKYGKAKTKVGKGNKNIGKEFIKEGSLFFEELSARDQDYNKIAVMDKELSLKLKTFCPPDLVKKSKSDLIVRIDEVQYEATMVDPDSTRTYLYWYLTKVGGVDE